MSEEPLLDDEEQPHLLLVDDDPTFTRVMARAMVSRGLRVSVANSAEEGLALARVDLPDYAVLDLKMEGDSGLVLLPRLLELDGEMRVVILTGYSSIATAVEAIKRGACNYLCKPADADDVLTALSISAATNTLTARAMEALPRLRDCETHSTQMLHSGDAGTLRRLGLRLTCEAEYPGKDLFF